MATDEQEEEQQQQRTETAPMDADSNPTLQMPPKQQPQATADNPEPMSVDLVTKEVDLPRRKTPKSSEANSTNNLSKPTNGGSSASLVQIKVDQAELDEYRELDRENDSDAEERDNNVVDYDDDDPDKEPVSEITADTEKDRPKDKDRDRDQKQRSKDRGPSDKEKNRDRTEKEGRDKDKERDRGQEKDKDSRDKDKEREREKDKDGLKEKSRDRVKEKEKKEVRDRDHDRDKDRERERDRFEKERDKEKSSNSKSSRSKEREHSARDNKNGAKRDDTKSDSRTTKDRSKDHHQKKEKDNDRIRARSSDTKDQRRERAGPVAGLSNVGGGFKRNPGFRRNFSPDRRRNRPYSPPPASRSPIRSSPIPASARAHMSSNVQRKKLDNAARDRNRPSDRVPVPRDGPSHFNQHDLGRRQRVETDMLAREQMKLRIERETFEREKAQFLRAELERTAVERERVAREREELRKRQHNKSYGTKVDDSARLLPSIDSRDIDSNYGRNNQTYRPYNSKNNASHIKPLDEPMEYGSSTKYRRRF